MLLFRFLIGDAQAIRTVAGGRWSWAVGLLMLLSAGFARDYDREDLLAEPWHLLLPFAASTALVLVLFAFIQRSKSWEGWPPGGRHFLGLLTAVWWMAPMAWLYAIPWERMLEPDAALRMQILTLQVISVWRVILAGRIVHVLFGGFWLRSYALVTAVACTCMLVALINIGPSVLVLMGGFAPEPWERRIQDAKLMSMAVCFLAGGTAWLIGIVLRDLPRPKRLVPAIAGVDLPWRVPVAATIAVMIWIGFHAVETQQQQRLATAVDQAWRQSRTVDAIAMLAQLERSALPTYWRAVPGWWQAEEWREAARSAIRLEAKPWLRKSLLDRIDRTRVIHPDLESAAGVQFAMPGDKEVVLALAQGLSREGPEFWRIALRLMEQPAPAPSP